MKSLMVPVSLAQLVLFGVLMVLFFVFLISALTRRAGETGAKRDNRSRLGIVLQAIGIGVAGFGPARVSTGPIDAVGIVSCLAVLLLMGGAIGLFAASSRALGRNWSVVARMRSDHELVRHGPYARVRHPIYLGLLLFMLALAAALGHYVQLVLAVPLFLAGTIIRTRIEDGMLEATFGDEFRTYARSTPALIPRLG